MTSELHTLLTWYPASVLPDHGNPVWVWFGEHLYSSRPHYGVLVYWNGVWGKYTVDGFVASDRAPVFWCEPKVPNHEAQKIYVSKEDFNKIIEMMENPPVPNDALRALFELTDEE